MFNFQMRAVMRDDDMWVVVFEDGRSKMVKVTLCAREIDASCSRRTIVDAYEKMERDVRSLGFECNIGINEVEMLRLIKSAKEVAELQRKLDSANQHIDETAVMYASLLKSHTTLAARVARTETAFREFTLNVELLADSFFRAIEAPPALLGGDSGQLPVGGKAQP